MTRDPVTVRAAAPGPRRGHVAVNGEQRLNWSAIVDRAAEIVESYDTSVTLRQLFYRLVSEQLIPNDQNAYKRLSSLTAKLRRDGAFPELIDRGRMIHRYGDFNDPAEALGWLARRYRVDRTRGQKFSLYLGVEKSGIVNQLQAWFGDLGVPILALGGYSSQSYVGDVVADVSTSGRPAVLLYAGDHDPSGEDIDRDFLDRSDCWARVHRVALTAEQVEDYGLPENPGKAADSRAAGFIARHGRLVQVELDALDPDTLRRLYADTIALYWDVSAHELALEVETEDRARLRSIADGAA